MADTLIQALIMHFHSLDEFPEGVRVSLVLENGVSLRGTIVSPDQFAIFNALFSQSSSEREERDALVGRLSSRQNPADGSWPPSFAYPLREFEPPSAYVHLIDVEYLSGGVWTPGSTTRVKCDYVVATGDQY